MRLVSLEKKADCSPTNLTLVAVFEQGGKQVRKHVRCSDAALAVCEDPKFYLMRELVRRAREATRDFAFDEYGPEKWKEHVNWGEFFDAPTEAELKMIEAAVE